MFHYFIMEYYLRDKQEIRERQNKDPSWSLLLPSLTNYSILWDIPIFHGEREKNIFTSSCLLLVKDSNQEPSLPTPCLQISRVGNT